VTSWLVSVAQNRQNARDRWFPSEKTRRRQSKMYNHASVRLSTCTVQTGSSSSQITWHSHTDKTCHYQCIMAVYKGNEGEMDELEMETCEFPDTLAGRCF
jgi:hypothetical protein